MVFMTTGRLLLPPATKLRQGNVFTPVRHSVHRGHACHAHPPCHACPRHAVNEWVVHVLLECILVFNATFKSDTPSALESLTCLTGSTQNKNAFHCDHTGGLHDTDPPGQRSPRDGDRDPHPGRETEVPPVDRMTDTCKNITLPQLRCGR